MAPRIKSHWHNEAAERSLRDIVSALAFIFWKIGKDKAINLHGQDFVYRDDQQRFGVIEEYLCFQCQILDRMAYRMLDGEARRELLVNLARRLAEHVQDNGFDLFGPGEYGRGFIAKLNQRAGEYAEFGFTEDGPSYPFLRHLGFCIQGLMGNEGENRWVIDQVMDKDGPEIARQVMGAIRDLFV